MKTTVALLAVTMLLGSAFTATAQSQSVREEIEAAQQRFMQALNSGDAAKIAAIFHEDAIAFYPDTEPLKGRPAIERYYRQTARPDLTDASKTVDVFAQGQFATEIGTWTVRMAADSTIQMEGSYTEVWKRESDTWKLFRDTYTKTREYGAKLNEHLKPLEYYIGNWTFEMSGPDGEKTKGTLNAKTDPCGSLLVKVQVGSRSSLAVYYWMPEAKAIGVHMSASDGSFSSGALAFSLVKPGMFVVHEFGYTGEAKPFAATQTCTRLSEDRFTWEKPISVEGTVQVPSFTATFSRVK